MENNYLTNQRVEQERNTSELIVERYLNEQGYYTRHSTKEEDWLGYDICVLSPKQNKEIHIDVKNSETKNQNTNNFLYTTVNSIGEHYTSKKTDYVAYLNRPSYLHNKVEIVFIEFYKLHTLLSKYPERQSKKHKLGKYVLISKDVIKSYGKTVEYFNIINYESIKRKY